jgi:hypothetical protein
VWLVRCSTLKRAFPDGLVSRNAHQRRQDRRKCYVFMRFARKVHDYVALTWSDPGWQGSVRCCSVRSSFSPISLILAGFVRVGGSVKGRVSARAATPQAPLTGLPGRRHLPAVGTGGPGWVVVCLVLGPPPLIRGGLQDWPCHGGGLVDRGGGGVGLPALPWCSGQWCVPAT